METGGYNGWEEGFFCCQQGEGCWENTRVGQTREWGAPPLGQERSGQAQRASWGPPLLCLPHCFLLGCHSRGMEYPILHSLKLIMPFHEFSPILFYFSTNFSGSSNSSERVWRVLFLSMCSLLFFLNKQVHQILLPIFAWTLQIHLL